MKRFSIALFLLISGLSAFATTVIPRSVEELATRSTQVVEGKAIRTWTQWNPEHTLIFTYTEFQVQKSLKGQSARTVTVKQLGGSADGITQKIAGVRNLRAGDEAVLFLHPSEQNDGTLAVTSLMQGHFRIAKTSAGETTVSNGTSGASSLDRAGGKITGYVGSTMSLSDLEERVRKVTK